MGKVVLQFVCSGIAAASAKIHWHIGEGAATSHRRAALKLASSTNDTQQEDCIVAGYEEQNPEKVYVGGPCSGLTMKNGEPEVGENFRWMSLGVVGAGWQKKGVDDEVKLQMVAGANYQFNQNNEDYMAIGTGGAALLPNKSAGLVLSQMSYLSKSNFTFKANSFIAGDPQQQENWMDTCVTPCCTPPVGDNLTLEQSMGCVCRFNGTDDGEPATACSGPSLPVELGQYKFSVFAKTQDLQNATHNQTDWQSYVHENGVEKGGVKYLNGDIFVDQLIDFTNMKTDTLVIDSPDGTSVRYADMKVGGIHRVKGIRMESDKFNTSFTFPLTFNVGGWEKENNALKTETSGVRNVKLYCVKPPAQFLKDLGDGYEESTKVVYVRYAFNVAGIDGRKDSGVWFAYDPTIEQTKATKVTPAATTTDASEAVVPGESSVSNNAEKDTAIVAAVFASIFLFGSVYQLV